MIPNILSIAGSDPSGGAGIQADIKTVTALGGYAMTAITALESGRTIRKNSTPSSHPSMIAASVIVVAFIVGLLLVNQQQHEESHMRMRGASLVRLLSQLPLDVIMQQQDKQRVLSLLEEITDNSVFSYLAVVDAGNRLVERIKPIVRSTFRPGVMTGLGGFGALFDLKAAGYDDPILVAATDGVGTKLKIAFMTDTHTC